MKTQKTLILLSLAMSLSVAPGCKNSSKSTPFDGEVTQEIEITKSQVAVGLKAEADAAMVTLKESQEDLKKAKQFRDDIKIERDQESNAIDKEILSVQVEGSIKEVQTLEKNVKMARDLVVMKRKNLNQSLKEISAVDQALLGEADAEFQMDFNNRIGVDQKMNLNEKKAVMEMSLDAARELTKSSEAKVQELNERLSISEEQLKRLGSAPEPVVELESRNIRTLMKDIDDANKILAVNMAHEDMLVRLFNDMSL